MKNEANKPYILYSMNNNNNKHFTEFIEEIKININIRHTEHIIFGIHHIQFNIK